MSNIPPLDLVRQYKLIGEDVSAAVLDVLASGRYIGGATVEAFQQQFAAYTGVEHCVSCNSGTDALYLVLRALKIGTGDEVITTPFTFIATAEVIKRVGAIPVFVDIEAESFNLDVKQLEAAITPKTKAIIPVHLFGQPVAMSPLMSIAEAYNLVVIEDCAQATGASWEEARVGSIGQVGCFSFFPTKNLGAFGDGGAVTTNDPALVSKIRSLKEHGTSPIRYHHDETGINSRLDAIQAAILQIKLRHLDEWNDRRRQVATRYEELLASMPGIVTPRETVGGRCVWNQYTIRVKNGKRDRLRQSLQDLGVSSMVYYPFPLHLQPVYQDLGYSLGHFPVAEAAANEVLSLPMFPELTFEEQEQVVYSLKDCL